MASSIPRIQYGFLSQSTDPINIKLPWQASTQDGLFKMNYRVESAEEDNLRFWAKTNKGEYVGDSNFGLDVRRYLFAPIPLLKDQIEQNAREQLPMYFPRLKSVKFEILTTEDISEISENTVIFKLRGVLRTDKTRHIIIEEAIGS